MPLTSLWLDRPRPAPEVGTLPDRTDVVVVGAGITGLTTAVLLARAGMSVTVLEARHVAAGTTGGSTAKVSVLQGTRLSTIARRHPAERVRRYVEASTDARDWVSSFCEDHGVQTQVAPAVTFAHGPSGEKTARRELRVAQQAGLPVEWQDELDVPFPTRGGVRLDGQLQVDPVAVCAALAEEAVRHGASVHEGVRVRQARGRAPVLVETSHGVVAAETVVVATGMPFLDRGGWFARMQPARSYSVAFRVAAPPSAMYLSADGPSRSLRSAARDDLGDLLLVGGSGHVTGRTPSERGHLDALRAWTRRWYPEAEETHAWSAQDYMPAHALPTAGPVLPGSDHVLVAGGFAKWGMTSGVAAALALAGRLTGGRPTWASLLEPWQRAEVRGLPDVALSGAEVGFEMARGWLRPVREDRLSDPDRPGPRLRTRRAVVPVAQGAPGEGTLSAVCTHLGGVVAWNDAEGSWDCPLHGSRFEADGAVLEGPATCGLRRL